MDRIKISYRKYGDPKKKDSTFKVVSKDSLAARYNTASMILFINDEDFEKVRKCLKDIYKNK